MAFTVIPNSDIDPGSPASTDLFTKLRDNDDFLFAQTDAAGLIFLEKITPTTDPITITFSGLDGDVDEVYLIKGRAKFSNAGGAGTGVQVNVDPNAITSSQGSAIVANLGASLVAASRMVAGLGTLASSDLILVQFEAIFRAAKIITSVAIKRTMYSSYLGYKTNTGTTPPNGGTLVAGWAETATNITSLQLSISGNATVTGNGFRDGSTFELYKLRQS